CVSLRSARDHRCETTTTDCAPPADRHSPPPTVPSPSADRGITAAVASRGEGRPRYCPVVMVLPHPGEPTHTGKVLPVYVCWALSSVLHGSRTRPGAMRCRIGAVAARRHATPAPRVRLADIQEPQTAGRVLAFTHEVEIFFADEVAHRFGFRHQQRFGAIPMR